MDLRHPVPASPTLPLVLSSSYSPLPNPLLSPSLSPYMSLAPDVLNLFCQIDLRTWARGYVREFLHVSEYHAECPSQ